MLRIVFVLSIICSILLACTQGFVYAPEDLLDNELYNALQQASNNNSVAFYKMPRSNEYDLIPSDPKNPLTAEKVKLGKMLFHESAFAVLSNSVLAQQTYSCASCHNAKAGFQSGLAQGIGDGGIGFGIKGEKRTTNAHIPMDMIDVMPIRTPSILNTAYQTNVTWNGQFGATDQNKFTDLSWSVGSYTDVNALGYQGLESQAIAALSMHRMSITKELALQYGYEELFKLAFPEISDEQALFSNQTAGLALAAYERSVLANQAPFQQWLIGNYSALSTSQKNGAVLFFGKAGCSDCHNGPSLANMEFYGQGFDDYQASEVFRLDANSKSYLGRGSFTHLPKDEYKFKVPQLYNLKDSPFLGHGASFNSIKDVVIYKNEAIPQNKNVYSPRISNLFVPLKLSAEEIEQITDFIENGLYDANLDRYEPQTLPSGYCFPNNDDVSRKELGCQ